MTVPSVDDWARAVLEQVDPEETIELARSLVRIPSITGREGRQISEFMYSWLRTNHLDAGLQEITPERVNVYARLPGEGGGPRLLLNGHLDTKPFENMTIDPTGAEIKDGRLYGRGACDMKSAVAGCMIALKAVARSGIPLRGTLLFGSEVGEEGGGWRFDDLLDAGHCACDLMICAEPTELDLHLGHRGSFPIAVRTTGLATHTGTAYKGVNAIEKMAKVVAALYQLPCFHREDPLWGRSPINAQEIRGGGKVTASVADECEVLFDIRLNPDLPPTELQRDLEAALARLRREDAQLQVEWRFRTFASVSLGGRPAVHLNPEHPLVRLVAGAAETVLAGPPRLAGFPGGCSAGICLRRGIPAVIFGPGSLEQAHSADEWIEIDQIVTAARVYALAAVRALAA